MKNALIFSALVVVVPQSMGQQDRWNDPVVTGIVVPPNTKVPSAVDLQGIHVIYWAANADLMYRRFNTEGGAPGVSVVIDNGIGGYSFASVETRNGVIYAIYKKFSGGRYQVRIAYSEDGGSTWNTTEIPGWNFATNNDANGWATTVDGTGIHVSWSEVFTHETYYVRLDIDDPAWRDPKNVTDHPDAQIGEDPSISLSPDRVHVSLVDMTNHRVRTRDRISAGWLSPETPAAIDADNQRNAVVGNLLHVVFAGYTGDPYPMGHLRHFFRDVASTNWSEQSVSFNGCSRIWPLYLSVTADSKMHAIYKRRQEELNPAEHWVHRYWDGTAWSDFLAENLDHDVSVGLSVKSYYNDLYLMYRSSGTGTIGYRQYDLAPAAPQNLVMSTERIGSVDYPKLTWTLNNEPDIESYKIWRRMQTEQTFTNIATVSHPTATYTDLTTQAGTLDTAFYKITAADIANLGQSNEAMESVASNTVWIRTNQTQERPDFRFPRLAVALPSEFALMPNFPNPFNPNTLIRYQLPRDEHVNLEVYDVLGQKVTALVNEEIPAGYHEVELDASMMAGGTYFYKMTAGEFIAVRKLLVVK